MEASYAIDATNTIMTAPRRAPAATPLPACFAGLLLLGLTVCGGAAQAEDLYASTHIYAKVKPGVEMARTLAGGQTFGMVGLAPEEGLGGVIAALGTGVIAPAASHAATRADIAATVGMDRWYRIELAPGTDALKAADMLKATWTGFEVCEIDPMGGLADVPNDTFFASQYSLLNTGQAGGTLGADINVVPAWTITSSNPTMTVAFLDSGVFPHTELDGRIVAGWNVPLGTADTSDVCSGHGTHVAGIATAKGNNGAGIAGVCWDFKIMPVVVVNPCSGAESLVADGLLWAVDHGADVVNMSLQYSVGSAYLQTAVQYAAAAGVPMIAATGNSNAVVSFPARWPETIAVAASNKFDQRWNLSNYGPEVDVTAPGDSIYSLNSNNAYITRSGTSMATPHVTGLVALMRAVYPSMNAANIRNVLMQSARDLAPTGFDNYTGAGVVNAAAAVAMAQSIYPGAADLNGDGFVDGIDLADFLSQWGTCASCSCTGDFNDDCIVDGGDLSLILSSWSGN